MTTTTKLAIAATAMQFSTTKLMIDSTYLMAVYFRKTFLLLILLLHFLRYTTAMMN